MPDRYLLRLKDGVIVVVAVLGLYFGFIKDKVSNARAMVTQNQLDKETYRAETIHEELREMIKSNAEQIRELTKAVAELKGYISAKVIK